MATPPRVYSLNQSLTPRQWRPRAAPHVSIDVAKWLRQRRAPMHSNMVGGQLSDSSKQQMQEVFHELDRDGSGSITMAELMAALRHIDMAGLIESVQAMRCWR